MADPSAPSQNTAEQSLSQSAAKLYPKPEAEYQQIVEDPHLFSQKLQAFHACYGSTFKIPKVGGRTLDLHHLFVEVTSRGGIENVIRERKWKEVTGTFNFPSSITSASFVLRKFYLSVLYHFEQVYYFRKEVPPASHADSSSEYISWDTAPNPEDGDAMNIQNSENFILEEGSIINGTIDAKSDFGYLITVEVGSEKYQGVLYHAPTPNVSTSSARGKKRRHQVTDPSRPKRNSSGYNFFFAEQYSKLKPSYLGQEKLITKNIGDLWNRLSEAEKQVYRERGLQDKERYRAEMLEFKSAQN